MAGTGHCPHCGKPLTTAGLPGLCPDCMFKAALQTESGVPEDQASGPRPCPEPGQIAKFFPQLEIIRCLGRGGMGVVYLARQPELKRLVALKILAPEKEHDPSFAERFLREAQALARLNHPNIVAVHDFGRVDGLCYLVMEYVDGTTLRELLRERRMAPEQALTIVPKICDALQFAHEQGVVHRDIKPENVLLDSQGRVKIADFGIAKIVGTDLPQPALTEGRQVIGTPHYMAPEQVEKPHAVDHRADIYSLGVVFYEMLTGELPLGKFAPPSARMNRLRIDVRLDEIVLHALEKEPERRYQQAGHVKTDIETMRQPAVAGGGDDTVAAQGSGAWWAWDSRLVWWYTLIPSAASAALMPSLYKAWGARSFVLLLAGVVGLVFSLTYAWIGRRVRRLLRAAGEGGGEAVEALIAIRERSETGHLLPFIQSPGVAVLKQGTLHLLLITGRKFSVALDDIVTVREVRWFSGTWLWRKRALVLTLKEGGAAAVALPRTTLERWRQFLGVTAVDTRGADPRRSDLRFAYAALGLFLAGTLGTIILLAVARRDEIALLFGGTALLGAFGLGCWSWRLQLGRVIALSTMGVLAAAGIAAAVLTEVIPVPFVTQRRMAAERDLQARARQDSASAAQRRRDLTDQENRRPADLSSAIPPVVVKTVPECGAADVDPALGEIVVTFSQPMLDGAWSWCQWAQGHFPEQKGPPRLSDARTAVLPVRLDPGKVYGLWLNTEQFDNFRNRLGTSAVPYLLIFQTKNEQVHIGERKTKQKL